MTPLCSLPLAFMGVGPAELVLFGVIALLLFGGDLPDVARTWGKYLGEFRRHVHGIREELNSVIYAESDTTPRLEYFAQRQQSVISQAIAAEGVAETAEASDAAPPAAEAIGDVTSAAVDRPTDLST